MKNIALIRTCISCSVKCVKNEFIRIVRGPMEKVMNGKKKLYIDKKNEKDTKIDILSPCDALKFFPGRSAYICLNSACLKKVQKSRRFEKVLKIRTDEEFYIKIEDIISKYKKIKKLDIEKIC